jgi:hypothetical protein
MRDGSTQLQCPSTYDVTVAASTTHYRVIVAGGDFPTQHADCNDDLPGATHLASPETSDEVFALQAYVAALSVPAPSSQYYVGVVQQPNSPTADANWFVFTGAAMPTATNLWGPGQPGDDVAGENNEENLGAINSADAMHDVTGNFVYGAICECDGLPIDPTIATYIP